ncbi:MAG TPA: heparan-alpha-glucosaminide N-acetyltransferase domain-containing protein [Anaerolineales bacterium]|nr:heparan-alpha-glucosaminide N-acetyltransferase domain-containing protein [Anaerolineales bacterium]
MPITGKDGIKRIQSIDLLRGIVITLMALDHVRMYFGEGTWYADPTNLATTTPLLFFTRWITHFCAPVFVFLAGTSAYLSGIKKSNTKEISRFLLTRGLWLVFVELVIVNFAWTFDITYSYRILQVIWAIGISMIALSALVFLPQQIILGVGLVLVIGHNLLDSISVSGNAFKDMVWYALHQHQFLILDSGNLDSGNVVNFVYPVLPWIGLMALGYVFGTLYKPDFDSTKRRKILLWTGLIATSLFLILRGFNLYGEPNTWSEQSTTIYSVLSFLNTTKYPPSLHFLLMTIGPALIFLSVSEKVQSRILQPIITFGKVPFFFYIAHLYFIHLLASAFLVYQGQGWDAYVISAGEIMSGRLGRFGVRLDAVYVIWMVVIMMLYPLCRWYQAYKEGHPEKRWLSYL